MEKQDEIAKHEVKYALSVIGSPTKRGGWISTASSTLTLKSLAVAVVGDVVQYPDGSQAVIMDGAGSGLVFRRDDERTPASSIALVGSTLSNGDEIAGSLRDDFGLTEEGAKSVKGLFDRSFVPAPPTPSYRLAVPGATTARGVVLCDTSSKWAAIQKDKELGNAAAINDLIRYSDGSTARIKTALNLKKDSGNFVPLGFVGSVLDNGDSITDSPAREGSFCSSIFEVVSEVVEKD